MMSNKSSGQVWRGTIISVQTDGLVWVVVPQLMGTEQLGPMPSHGTGVPGGQVLVVFLGGSRQDMIAVPDADAHFDEVDATLGKIRTPSKAWAPVMGADSSAVSTEWDADRGWVSWIDLAKVESVGDVSFRFPNVQSTASVARPYGWQMGIVLDGVSGATGLRPKIDYMNAGVKTGSNAEITLAVWPDWGYQVEHDFILPANTLAAPTFVALGVSSSAVGRIGLSSPMLATKSERSQ